MKKKIIEIKHLGKEYQLGTIGGTTLRAELQSKFSKLLGKDDPNLKLGEITPTNEKFWALRDVNISIFEGERVGIIGHNGAGKSTLLKLLTRVTYPTLGSISYDGRIASMLEVGTGFHPELTGRENIYLNGAILGMSKSEISKKIDSIIKFAELEQFVDTPVKRYSSGMYVKLAFAVAAHLDADIMVMDEVLAVGDMKFQQKCLQKMDEKSKEENKTILYVSHNMNTIRQLCERCVVLEKGSVVFDGDVETAIEIYSNIEKKAASIFEDLSQRKRGDYQLGKKFKIESITLLNSTAPKLKKGENLKFKLKLKANSATNDLCFRFMIYTAADVPVAMSGISKGLLKVDVGYNNVVGNVNSKILAPGLYYLKIALYNANDFGAEELLDVVNKAIYFEISHENLLNNLPWLSQYWGNIEIPMDIELSQKSELES